MHQQTQVRVLALLFALGAVLCLASAAHPLDPASPVVLMAALGCAGVAIAVAVLLLGRRWPVTVTHAGFALLSGLVCLCAARSVTAVGVVGLGPGVIAACLYAAHAFSARAGRAHVLVLLAAASAGAVLSPARGFSIPWLIVPITAAVVFEVHGRLLRRLVALATRDPLTGVTNRRSWEQTTARDLAQAQRSGQPLSVAILDLDGFKLVNDSHGHAAGDALLREVTTCWQRELRRGDLLGRWGGDEFVISLPNTTSDEAAVIVDRLREVHPVRWSTGLATSAHPGGGLEGLLARADAALYADKRARAS